MITQTITFKATFTGGEGSITFSGVEGTAGDITLCVDDDHHDPAPTFTSTQTGGYHDPTVSGTAPADGKISVEVFNEAGKSLAKKSYTGQFIDEDFDYTV